MSFGEVNMYCAIVVALLLGVGFLLLAWIQFIKMQALEGFKYVDSGKGKVLDYVFDMPTTYGDENTPKYLLFLVECYINGIYYKQYTERTFVMKLYTLRREVKARVGKEIGLKYIMNKEGNVKLYVYEEKEVKKQIGQFIIIGTISLILFLAISF